jgi:cysteine desulfurase
MAKKIYLDYAATTPVDKKVLKKMQPFFSEKFGNASSLHGFGQEVRKVVEEARKDIADFFGAKSQEIIFTSGATESNNLAIKGIVRAYYAKPQNKNTKPHIITTSFEHHCVLDSVKSLEKEGLIEVDYVFPDKNGIILPESIEQTIRKNTILVSVMFVNNEIGTVQPIAEIGKMVSKIRKENQSEYPLFHTDATQAVNFFDCNAQKLGADLLSASAHKIYGPKGVGVLYVKNGALIERIQDGGSQEWGKRAGTLNHAGIVGLSEAIRDIKTPKNLKKIKKIKLLRDHLMRRILKEIPKTFLNGSRSKRSPNNVNISFRDVEGESLLLMLDAEGIAVSTGSACSSGSLAPSHALLSIGLKPEEAHGSIRFTLGKFTTKKEIDVTVEKLKKIVEKLRKVSGSVLEDYYKENKN